MVRLTLAGLSDDGATLLLINDAGDGFRLSIDDTLRAAIRGERTRIGQLEIEMESALRPRDIQSRIRAGETAEAVALVAQTAVEKIMPFAAPVLAERAHVATMAQRSSLRGPRGTTPAGGQRTLGETARMKLRDHGIDPETVAWDAFRREDGKWVVTGSFADRTARFIFDLRGNYSIPDSDDALWLSGEQPSTPEPAFTEIPEASGAGAVAASQPRKRRLSPVPSEQLPLGDEDAPVDGASPVRVEDTEDQGFDPQRSAASQRTQSEPQQDLDASDSGEPQGVEPEPETSPEPEPAPRRPVRKSRGRASVPSWDEIMFGGGPTKD